MVRLSRKSDRPHDMPEGLYQRILQGVLSDSFWIDKWPMFVHQHGAWASARMFETIVRVEAQSQMIYEARITEEMQEAAQAKSLTKLVQAMDVAKDRAYETGKPARALLPLGMVLRDKWT